MTPLDILQVYLDRNGAAIMAGDLEGYAAGLDLPFALVTASANITIATREDVRTRFDGFVEMLHSQRVTDFIRLATRAEKVAEDLISGSYETEMLSHGRRVLMPFPSRIVIRRCGADWRAAAVVNPIMNDHWPSLVPAVKTDPERTEP